MSAFERLPAGYRKLCKRIAGQMPPRLVGWPKVRPVPISPQNRMVRFAADSLLASQKSFPNTETRQQRRWAEQQDSRWRAKRRRKAA